MSLVFGTAPDSWGVWLADHPSQPHWKQFLDEAASTGHRIIELGPYGYLPTDPAQLKSELDSRGLSLIAATMVAPNLHIKEDRKGLRQEVLKIAQLSAPLGAKYFVLMVDGYRQDHGVTVGPAQLPVNDWGSLVENCDLIGKVLWEDFGMVLTFHPHADSVVEYSTQVERLLDDSDPRFTQLCLDTGHYHYKGGDSAQLMRGRFDRIPYLHLKSIDAEILKIVQEKDLSFGEAVGLGIACEPDRGSTNFLDLKEAIDFRESMRQVKK